MFEVDKNYRTYTLVVLLCYTIQIIIPATSYYACYDQLNKLSSVKKKNVLSHVSWQFQNPMLSAIYFHFTNMVLIFSNT